jgi:hypothetical protein
MMMRGIIPPMIPPTIGPAGGDDCLFLVFVVGKGVIVGVREGVGKAAGGLQE